MVTVGPVTGHNGFTSLTAWQALTRHGRVQKDIPPAAHKESTGFVYTTIPLLNQGSLRILLGEPTHTATGNHFTGGCFL